MKQIKKAYAISDAKISFVSLVDKAANKQQFLIVKSEDENKATFQTFGEIIKTDTDSHYVTGIVYEPMTEDTDGNYMTENEIVKAAHWFMKNTGNVDIQHCFTKAENCNVVESYIAKCDMEIEGKEIKKGSWLMTVEIADSDVWNSIEKGELTGFSMGGVGVYSEEDIDLSMVEKSDESEGLLKKLAKAFGFEVVEKGRVKDLFNRRAKEENFYSAWRALNAVLEGSFYNPDTGSWEYGFDSAENTIKDALKDFNDIVTKILTNKEGVVKALEKDAKKMGVKKVGKSLSSKNLETLQTISSNLNEFLSAFDQEIKKEENMTESEVKKMISEEVKKAVDGIGEKLDLVNQQAAEVKKSEDVLPSETVQQMITDEIKKAMEPINEKLETVLKSRALPSNLNPDADTSIEKSKEPHYMAGIF